MKRAQNCIKPNLLRTKSARRGGPQIRVTQNSLKHILVLEFLKSDKFCKWPQQARKATTILTHIHTDNMVCHSTLKRRHDSMFIYVSRNWDTEDFPSCLDALEWSKSVLTVSEALSASPCTWVIYDSLMCRLSPGVALPPPTKTLNTWVLGTLESDSVGLEFYQIDFTLPVIQ